jgi:hypothetical protein
MSRNSVTNEQIRRELAETDASLPIASQLADLFTDRKMFDSTKAFEKAGFRLIAHAPHKIMSGFHKGARGFLFKKYNNDKPGKKQIKNYMRRVEGARLMRKFITERGFQHVVAPHKWLHELPSGFPERYLVVADKLDLLDDDATKRKYDRIREDQMHELATMLFYFRGLNSWTKNLPFTEDGKIAFIDTERWHRDKDLLRSIGDHLPSDRREQAEDVFDELRRKRVRPFVSAFK